MGNGHSTQEKSNLSVLHSLSFEMDLAYTKSRVHFIMNRISLHKFAKFYDEGNTAKFMLFSCSISREFNSTSRDMLLI